jgi:hypothetical protein
MHLGAGKSFCDGMFRVALDTDPTTRTLGDNQRTGIGAVHGAGGYKMFLSHAYMDRGYGKDNQGGIYPRFCAQDA